MSAPAVATAQATPSTVQARSRPRRRRQGSTAALMLAPAVILIVTFLLVPIALTFALAFTNARLVSPVPMRFTGLDNFARLFADPTFWTSLRNTAIFAVFVVPLQAGLALVLALLINKRSRGVNIFRTIWFLPVVTSMVVVSMLWTFMYQKTGLINSLLARIGIDGPDWLGDPRFALAAIIVMSIWQNAGFHMVIWLAGLQTIDQSLYEAASLDGASGWRLFSHVTWPGLRQTRTFILITITIAALALFTQINIMTQGGPLDSTTTVVYMAVRTGFQQQQTGYASAISLVFFVIVLLISAVQRFLTRDRPETSRKAAR